MHHMIADRLRVAIQAGNGPGTRLSPAAREAVAKSLEDPANLPFLFLGCQGPDFLFFNTRDMDPKLKAMVTTYFDVADFIENFKRTLIGLVPAPIMQALAAFDEAVDTIITSSATLSELQQLFTDMSAVVDALNAMVTEAAKRFISDFALFEQFGHPYRDGVPAGPKPAGFSVAAERAAGTSEWWWFDALHYRKTGKFAQALLNGTAPGTALHLYALGYLTHVAADTVGHPYVNIISGGPYRSQAQRHKASENYQDVFNMMTARGVDWNASKLHALYNFNYRGLIDTENDVPDPFTNLDPALAQLIVDALNAVYDEDGDPARPEYAKPISVADLNDTYRLWYRWLKSSTDTGTLPPPVPYSLSAELREVWDKAMNNLGDIGDFITDAAGRAGSGGILGLLLALAAAVLAAIAAAAAIIDAVLGALTTLGSSTIRAAARLVYDQLYTAFENFRLGVAMNGLAFPLPQHLADPRLIQWGNPSIPDPNGTAAPSIAGRIPMLRLTAGGLLHMDLHLTYPPTAAEMPPVFAHPTSYLDKESVWYAWGDIPFDPAILETLEKLVPSDDPAGNDDGTGLSRFVHDKALLGNALALTGGLYDMAQGGARLPDFNLDGDRGYGFLCWQQRGDLAPDFPDPANSSPALPGIALNFIR